MHPRLCIDGDAKPASDGGQTSNEEIIYCVRGIKVSDPTANMTTEQ